MLVITGVFENERFIPDRPVSIPQKKKVTITIEQLTSEIVLSTTDANDDKPTNSKWNGSQ